MPVRRMVLFGVAALAGLAAIGLGTRAMGKGSPARTTGAERTRSAALSGPTEGTGPAHRFGFTAIDGGELSLAAYRGRVVMVVNTASQCGFTPQYEAMQSVWERYRERGLVVLAVPSDDFNQELATDGAVKDFCETTFGIDFPMTTITAITGDGAHPFYTWAREELGAMAAPRWNFHKYLIDRQGRLVRAFSTATPPDSPRVIAEIERLLAGRA